MKVSVLGISDISKQLKREVTQVIQTVANEVQSTAKSNTPIRSGNARRNWTKTVSDTAFNVENRVPYIERLEAGASKQAPRGIVSPTLTQLKGVIK